MNPATLPFPDHERTDPRAARHGEGIYRILDRVASSHLAQVRSCINDWTAAIHCGSLASRARWGTRRVLVVDLGDRVVMRPATDDPLDGLEGKYRDRAPRTDEARRQARREEAVRERKR